MGVKTLTLNMCSNDDDDKDALETYGRKPKCISFKFMFKSLLRLPLCNLIYCGSLILCDHVGLCVKKK